MATMDTTIAHIMDEPEDIKIKSSKCWNPIRPTATLLTSNGRRICIRPPFSVREYLMEISRSPLSNGSSLITKFHVVWPQSHKQGIGLICTGKINYPRRGVSIAKPYNKVCEDIDTSNLHWGAWLSRWICKTIGNELAQHRHLCQDMRSDQHDTNKKVHNHEKEERDMKEPSLPLFTLKFDAPPSSKERIIGNLHGAAINQEQPLVEPIVEMPLSQVDLLVVPCDKEELCDNASLISMPQLMNEHAIPTVNSYCADFRHVVHIANEVEEHELTSFLNTLGYIQFDNFCELDNLKEKLFAKSDLPCLTNAIFHIFGEYDDRGI
uniref:Retrotransposon, putative, centromere-specific n=2 Tax=Oryza sativa subsp. japonica TaxID=39947 RepID=Q53JB0_ORYSJ|nr:hypothetical protein [Oryza sativa Japonica Group]ABA93047.1 retrotransposon, putative, centromere-specific [Oryza sativa Japonica Group]